MIIGTNILICAYIHAAHSFYIHMQFIYSDLNDYAISPFYSDSNVMVFSVESLQMLGFSLYCLPFTVFYVALLSWRYIISHMLYTDVKTINIYQTKMHEIGYKCDP